MKIIKVTKQDPKGKTLIRNVSKELAKIIAKNVNLASKPGEMILVEAEK